MSNTGSRVGRGKTNTHKSTQKEHLKSQLPSSTPKTRGKPAPKQDTPAKPAGA